MKVPVYSKEGKKKGEVVLNPEIYSRRGDERLLELVKKAYAANLRRGTHDTKVRKEVRGGGRKPWKQKGTGRARAGSTRSPIWKGGGTIFGPHPRNYYVAMPNSMRRQALASAFGHKANEKNLFLVEDFKLESAKTKNWVEIVKAMPLKNKRALCVVKEFGENLKRATRNVLPLVDVQAAKDVNAFQVLNREKLMVEQDALEIIESRINGKKSEAKVAEKKEKKVAKAKKTVKKTVKKKTVAKKKVAKKATEKKGKKSS